MKRYTTSLRGNRKPKETKTISLTLFFNPQTRGKLDMVKLLILPLLIYKFNTVPVKIPRGLFFGGI